MVTCESFEGGGSPVHGGVVLNSASLGGVVGIAGSSNGAVVAGGGSPSQNPGLTPPTAAALVSFGAHWLSVDAVAVEWQSGVEYDLLGFQLQRQSGGADWIRVGPSLIPAEGYGQPRRYRFVDRHLLWADRVHYRLHAVDLAGQRHLVAQTVVALGLRAGIAWSPGDLVLSVEGAISGKVIIEASASLTPGSWERVDELEIDLTGRGSLKTPLDLGSSGRFYRVRQE